MEFVESSDLPYDDVTHYKVVKDADNIIETIYTDFNIFVAELKSKNNSDIDEKEESDFYKKYESEGYEFCDGSRIASECRDNNAILIMIKE
ncbi:hypothetical protein [Burkholderia cepacia]|uniref:hypothetical protein n=1 Tax=Burkholderia cepacia TaxID=292 RepID=UPI00158C7288|nr:hypothetical protein [Burkholderia cepacia]